MTDTNSSNGSLPNLPSGGGGPEISPAIDPAEATAFLERNFGLRSLVAFPNGMQTSSAIDANAMRGFVEAHAELDIFFQPAEQIGGKPGKLKKPYFQGSRWAWVDLDPPKGLSGDALVRWRSDKLDELERSGLPRPHVIVNSGRGLWCFWRLSRLVDVDEIEAINRALAYRLGGDHVWNADRLARLPFTRNSKTNAVGFVLLEEEGAIEPDDLPRELLSERKSHGVPLASAIAIGEPLGSLDDLAQFGLPSWARETIENGVGPDDHAPANDCTRSGWRYKLLTTLARYGVPQAMALSVLTDPRWGLWQAVAENARGRDGYAIREVLRAYAGISRGPADDFAPSGISIDDFRSYMPMHQYVHLPSGEMWPAASVNSRIPVVLEDNPEGLKANQWLDKNRAVEQMTWAPGRPQIVADQLVREGGWFEQPGCNVLNQYRPPTEIPGDASKAGPWINHIRGIYTDHADHIIDYLAHRVQRPGEKVNHALVLGGAQGIGKDTILEPVKVAVGPWNVAEVSPKQVMGRFNSFLKSVILRVSEARDLGDVDRFTFYDHMKTLTAAPPNVLRVDEKFVREYSAFNCCGVIITTNHRTDGIYLPADDRRHYVAWSDRSRDGFDQRYWKELYEWYASGGIGHVAAYLRQHSLVGFDPNAPPLKTDAFWAIVAAGQAPEDGEMADALETLGWCDAVTVNDIACLSCLEFNEWLRDRKSARKIPHRMEEAGYVAVRNHATKDGRFKVGGKNTTIYARKDMSLRDQIAAAEARAGRPYNLPPEQDELSAADYR